MDIVTSLTPVAGALAFLGKVVLLSLACGIGPYLYLVPERVRREFLGTTLLLALGMGVALLASVYCLALALPCKYAVPCALVVSSAFLVGGLLRPSDLAGRLRSALAGAARWKWHLALGLFVALLVVLPGAGRGLAQPYRVGSDEVGYASTAQTLLDGGSFEGVKSGLTAPTGEADAYKALESSDRPLELNTIVANNFLVTSRRWYPSVVAATLSTLGETYVLPLQFVLLYLPVLLSFGAAHHLLRSTMGVSDRLSLLGATAVLLNANLLNALCEGQHALVFASPFFCLLLAQLFFFRNGDPAGGPVRPGRIEYLFTGLLAAVMFCAYSDLFFLLLVLLALLFGLDVLLRRKVLDRGLLRFALALGLGFVLAGPYSAGWPEYIYRLLKFLHGEGPSAGPGYWQPQWAAPAEILGLFDIYDPAVPYYVGRGPLKWLLVLGVSLLCVEVVALRFLWGKRLDVAFWLAPVLFVGAVLVKVVFVNHTHNYQYAKAYTAVLPLLTVLFLGALHSLAREGGWPRVLLPACVVWVVVVGCVYLKRYSDEASYLAGSPSGVAKMKGSLDWDGYVWVTTSDGLDTWGRASTVRMNWLNFELAPQDVNLAPYAAKRVGVWCSRKDLGGTLPDTDLAVLYEDDDIVLLDTGLTLRDSRLGPDPSEPEADVCVPKAKLRSSCAAFLRTHGLR